MSQNNPYDEVSQQVAHEMMPLKGDENPEVGFKSNSYDQYDTRNLDKVYFSRLKHIIRDPKSGELKGLQSKDDDDDVVDHHEKVRSYDEIDACGIFSYKDLLEYLYSDRLVLGSRLLPNTPISFYKHQFISNALLITSLKKSQKSLLKKGKIGTSLESETSCQLATMLIEKNGCM